MYSTQGNMKENNLKYSQLARVYITASQVNFFFAKSGKFKPHRAAIISAKLNQSWAKSWELVRLLLYAG